MYKNNQKTRRKGFTLTEMIVVIAIIGILAGVLIPTITGYIKKAKISKGVQEAKNISVVLSAEAAFQDRDYFEPYEIARIIEEYDYSLKTTLKEYRFWYDASINEVKFLSMEEAFGSSSVSAKLSKDDFSQNCIEALSSSHPEYRYVDEYDDALTNLVYTVRNLPTLALDELSLTSSASANTLTDAEKLNVIDKMDSLLNDAVEDLNGLKYSGLSNQTIINYASTFNTNEAVYIDDNYMYNRAYFTPETGLGALSNSSSNIVYDSTVKSVSLTVSQMVFTPNIEKVPASKEVAQVNNGINFDVTITSSFEIPDTVTVIENKSFTNIVFAVGIVIKDTVIYDPEVFSDAAKDVITDRPSNVIFVTLFQGVDFNILYNAAEAKLNNGLLMTYTNENNEVGALENIVFKDGETVIDDSNIISKYLVPHIEFTNSKIDFSKIEKIILRRSLLENICTYSAVLVDTDLNCYKVENFGYISDIDWKIEQEFKVTNNEAIVKIYLPTYVYNYSNFKDASMEVVLLPQVIKTTEIESMQGIVEVYDGLALGTEPIIIQIKDGVYDSQIGKYVYEKKIENLQGNYSVLIDEIGYACNQVTLANINIYIESNDSKQYIFIRNYQKLTGNANENN